MEMYKIITARPIIKYIIYLEFNDGLKGELDLSFAAHKGVFENWEIDDNFFKLKIVNYHRAIEWPGETDMCADSLYLRLIENKQNAAFAENKYASN